MLLIGISTFFALTLSSCIDCVDGNGNIVSQNRTAEISNFNQIELNGSFSLEITQDSTFSLLIDGDENILSSISSTVSDQRLRIESEHGKCFNTDDAVLVRISVNDLSRITLNGSGNIYTDSLSGENLTLVLSGSGDFRLSGLKVQSLDATIYGSGNMNLSGRADETYYRIDGSGNVRSFGLEQQTTEVVVNGSGNVYVSFVEHLKGVINGSGNILYKTSTGTLDVEVNGSGKVTSSN